MQAHTYPSILLSSSFSFNHVSVQEQEWAWERASGKRDRRWVCEKRNGKQVCASYAVQCHVVIYDILEMCVDLSGDDLVRCL